MLGPVVFYVNRKLGGLLEGLLIDSLKEIRLIN